MTPAYHDEWLTIYGGDVRDVLPSLAADSVDCIVTSPPYWGLRDYGTATWEGGDAECDHKNTNWDRDLLNDGGNRDRTTPMKDRCRRCGAIRIDSQIGLERTPEEYVANMVAVFRELRRVLKPTGTCWLNLGDSYFTNWGSVRAEGGAGLKENGRGRRKDGASLAKQLVGIPWRVAFALQQPYYTGTIKDEKDRIWLAAMLDGEGCLFIHKRKIGQNNGQGYARKSDSYGSGMEIANTSEAIVRRCMEITGKGSIVRQEKDRRQPLYRWNLRSNECREVVREVYEHLVAKQHQARLLIGCPSSGPKAEAAHQALMDLHNGIPTDVDFPAPESMWEPGWYLRSDVVWAKSNPMPESVTDRPTKSHEMVFLLTKSPRYYFDADAVREQRDPNEVAWSTRYADTLRAASERRSRDQEAIHPGREGNGDPRQGGLAKFDYTTTGRNIRSVWTIATRPYPGAHFAVFPPELPERCIKAGSSEKGVCPECGAPWKRVVERKAEGWHESPKDAARRAQGLQSDVSGLHSQYRKVITTDRGWRPTCEHTLGDWQLLPDPSPAVILDPFGGSGTVGMVANRLSRRAILIDLNPEYLRQQLTRNAQTPLGLTEGDAA